MGIAWAHYGTSLDLKTLLKLTTSYHEFTSLNNIYDLVRNSWFLHKEHLVAEIFLLCEGSPEDRTGPGCTWEAEPGSRILGYQEWPKTSVPVFLTSSLNHSINVVPLCHPSDLYGGHFISTNKEIFLQHTGSPSTGQGRSRLWSCVKWTESSASDSVTALIEKCLPKNISMSRFFLVANEM